MADLAKKMDHLISDMRDLKARVDGQVAEVEELNAAHANTETGLTEVEENLERRSRRDTCTTSVMRKTYP